MHGKIRNAHKILIAEREVNHSGDAGVEVVKTSK
jgi:hypothetical protein